jgi:hypothetical protein
MTTQAQAREAVYQCFEQHWLDQPGNVPRLPYCYDNEGMDPAMPAWVRLTVRHVGRRQISLGSQGNRRFETTCELHIDYYEAPGRGVRDTDEYVRPAADIFEGKALAGTTVKFQAVGVRELGVVEDGSWWAAKALGRFTYEEIK